VADLALERSQVVTAPLAETFAFFSDPQNLEPLTPAWLNFGILEAPETLGEGALLRYRLRLFGLPIRWRTEIARWDPPRSFTDVQVRGPYRVWVHTHRFTAVRGGTEVYDHVRYRVPFGALGRASNRLFVRRWLNEIFDYRAARLADVLDDGRDRPRVGNGSDVP
jgi:ligand-binding SRPBCC domain-containing protein